MGQQGPRESGKTRGGDEGQRPVGADIDPRGLGQLVLPVHRVEGQPDRGALDPPHDPQRDANDHQREVIVADRLEEIEAVEADVEIRHRVDPLDPLGPAEGVAEAFPQQPDDLARGKRADQEVEPLHPEQREAEEQRDQCGGHGPQQHRERHEDTEFLGVERRGVGADPHHHHMAQRPLPGERQQPVGGHQQHVDGQEDQDLLLREAEPVRQRDHGRGQRPPANDMPHGVRHGRRPRTDRWA